MSAHGRGGEPDVTIAVAEYYAQLVDQARRGDKRAADELLHKFSRLSRSPNYFKNLGPIPRALLPLFQHVATCIADWRKRDYRDAETWFFVERPSHRPPAEIGSAQVQALRAYRLFLARGKGTVESLAAAVRSSGLSEGQVRYLLAKKGDEKDALEAAVLYRTHPRFWDQLTRPPRKKYQRSR